METPRKSVGRSAGLAIIRLGLKALYTGECKIRQAVTTLTDQASAEGRGPENIWKHHIPNA